MLKNCQWIFLIFIFQINGIAQIGYDKCFSNSIAYYAKQEILLYEHMDTESAVKKKIAKGDLLYVTDSFFGTHGWWKICHNGDKGYVKKKYLSTSLPINTPKVVQLPEVYKRKKEEISIKEKDIGYAPFIARLKDAGGVRLLPDKTGEIIKMLPKESRIYVISNIDDNGYYKVIDIKSGIIGWIDKNIVIRSI